MKAFFITAIVALFFVSAVQAQSKSDSIKLRTDIERISKGQKPQVTKKRTVVNAAEIPARVDSTATKPSFAQPTPAAINNPNPHQAVPSASNPEPPATPKPYPVTPVADKPRQ